MSQLIKKALYFAAEHHNGQYRKGGQIPFIVHPILVSYNILKYTDDEEIISAGLLHDVLEDCPSVSEEDLEKNFGKRITSIVKEVSFLEKDKDQTLTWRENKTNYINKLKNISNDALLIITSDKMSNLEAYFTGVKEKNPAIETSFKGSVDDYIWYYKQIEKVLIESLGNNHNAVKDYVKKISDLIK